MMATIIQSRFNFNPYSHSYAYSCQRKSFSPSLSRENSKRSDYHINNAKLFVADGYGYGGRHLCQVNKASKQDHNGSESKEEERENKGEEEWQWVREEQRWLREEKRWLREEGRWNAERESLLRQISHLSLKIQDMELELEAHRNRAGSAETLITKITSLLQLLNTTTTTNTINETPFNPKPLVLESGSSSKLELESQPSNLERERKEMLLKPSASSLKMGSEGEEVRALQEALLNLGFYSGEEDMEYSSFSSGTQCAVKSWQASIGVPEDGVITSELLERLNSAQQNHNSGSYSNANQGLTVQEQIDDEANGAPTVSVAEVREVQQTVVKEGPLDVETSQVKCRTCQGEGRLLCMDCDGSGEPNVEPQFLEWVGEGAKCPYCEGSGYTVCEVCDGKAVE